MISEIRNRIWIHVKNIPGWTTDRRILVIEADDYGSIRAPSLKALEALRRNNIIKRPVRHYMDSLENCEDLELLYKVLSKFRDKFGKYSKVTPFFVVANPDFDAIEQLNFSEYVYKEYRDVLEEYRVCKEIHSLWNEGCNIGFFRPQYHGREHLNVPLFMKLLRESNTVAHDSFKLRYCHPEIEGLEKYMSLRSAYYFVDHISKAYMLKSIIEGVDLFYNYFGYRPTVFCPSNGVFHDDFKEALYKHSLRGIVESGLRYVPDGFGGLYSRRKFIIGKMDSRSKLLTYSRNVIFEPIRDGINQSVKKALREIDAAYTWRKPAIIGTHRSNYCGGISTENRKNGLSALECLLREIVKRWPDVEFLNSEELTNVILSNVGK